MNHRTLLLSLVLLSVAVVFGEVLEDSRSLEQPTRLVDVDNLEAPESQAADAAAPRDKRTLFLKKKLAVGAIGFGLGLGVGALKGYAQSIYLSS